MEGASISFRLLPQFWQTWWFRSALGLLFVLILAGFYRVRVSRIQEMERLRVRIAADLHDEIGSSIGSISLLTQKIQKEGPLMDDQKADLSSIGRISTQAANAIREIVWFINPQYDTMQDLLSRMRDAAGTMLAGMRVRLTFPQEDMTRKVSPEFRRNTFLMFKEMLGNIIKHSRATEVEIVVVDKKRVWLLIVRDNGVGFNADGAFSGNGLKNLRHRADRLNGSLEIRGQPGSGTTIIFSTSKL
jgi:signal transduction histidine kinase